MTQYDVVVAGAGPAGSTTAYHLVRTGAKVLLLDRAEFPRVKPCGGGVTARALKQAPFDLTPIVERRINRVRFSYRLGDYFDHEYPETLAYMTQRDRLDAYLAERSVSAGAEFVDNCGLRTVRLDGSGVEIETSRGTTVQARVLVGSDGANGIVARFARLTPVTEPPVALEANFPYEEGEMPPQWANLLALEVGSMPGGYGWSFPKADHFNVGCGGWHNEGARLRDHLGALRHHYGLDEATMLNLRGHHLPVRTPGAPIVSGRILLAGDAAGLVDPLSGEGIYAAFVSGRLAAAAVQRFLEEKEPDLLSYEAAVDCELMPDIRVASILRDVFHWAPRLCYEALRRSGLFRRFLCELMIGRRTYVDLLKQLGPAAPALRVLAAQARAARRRELARQTS